MNPPRIRAYQITPAQKPDQAHDNNPRSNVCELGPAAQTLEGKDGVP